MTLADDFAEQLERALRACGYPSTSAVARYLGISRTTLRHRLIDAGLMRQGGMAATLLAMSGELKQKD